MAETLLDFGRRRAQNEEAAAAYDAAVAVYRETTLTAFQEVQDSLAALRQLEIESGQQQSATQAAEESLTLRTDQYREGTVSYLNVITAQTTAYTHERLTVQLLGRRMTSAVQLVLALGSGWNASSLPAAAELKSP